jgi:cytidylate kinase
MTKKQVIVLTGVSGTGKSDLSKQLADGLGFSRVGMSEFFLQVAHQRGYRTLQEFNRAEGFQSAYFDLIPEFILEIRRQSEQKPGIIIDGVYDPELYDSIRGAFKDRDVRLFNICARRRERLHWLNKREAENSKRVKRERDRNKKIFGVNAMMTRPDAIPIRVSSIPEAIRQITLLLVRSPQISRTPISRARSKSLQKKAQQAHRAMKHRFLRP